MKTLVCIFAILACTLNISTATSPTISVQERSRQVAEKCVGDLHLDGTKIIPVLKPTNPLPEDDADFTNFFVCYWKTLGIINDDGVLHDLTLTVMLTQLVEDTFKLSASKAEEVAKASVEKCKGIQADTVGLASIKRRNCIFQEVTKVQHH